MLGTVREPDLGERTAGESTCSHEAPMQDGPRASSDANISCLEHRERNDRGVQQVSHFMSQEPRALIPSRRLSIQRGLILFAAELRDGIGDRLINAPIKHATVIRSDGRLPFQREFDNGLTNVAIVMHDLRHGGPLTQPFMPVLHRAHGHVRTRDQMAAERVGKLVQKYWHAAIDFRVPEGWHRPCGDLRPAPPDDFLAVHGNEIVEH